MRATLFISDLHLDDRRPQTLKALLDLLRGPASGADGLYILGDLFEFWIGDDAPPSLAGELADSTAALHASGTPCYFIHGNRDFLLAEQYAERAALQLLPESCVVDLYGTPTLLLHGDTLCTDDKAYQAFRRQSRDPAWQTRVLSMTVEERLQLARDARDASMMHTGSAPSDIMDVNEQAVVDAFLGHGVHRMIHGHTHRPARHLHDLGDGSEGERIVLPDWCGGDGGYLMASAEGLRSVALGRSAGDS